MVAKTIGFIFTIVLPLLLARRLSTEEFGNYKLLFQILGSANNLLPMGVQMSAFYFLPRSQTYQEKARVVYYILLFYLLTTGLCGGALMVMPSLLQSVFGSGALAASGRLVGLTVILWVYSFLLEAISVANQDSQLAARYIVVANLMRTILLLIAAVVWGNIQAIVLATAAYSALLVGIMFHYFHKNFGRFWSYFEWNSLRHQLSYAIPMGVTGFLWVLQMDVHNYFVSRQFGPTMFAVYSVGCFQLPLIGILSDSVSSVLIPRVSALQHQGGQEEIKVLTAKVMRTLAAVFFPVYAFLSVMAAEFITLLYTSRYAQSVPVFRINLLFLPLTVIVIDPIMRAYAEQRYFMLRLNVIVLAALIASFWFGLPAIGLTGTIGLVVVAQYISRFIALRRTAQLLHLHRADLVLLVDIAKIGGAALVGGVVAFAIHIAATHWQPIFPLLVGGTAFVAVYAAMLFILRVPTAEEILQGKSWVLRRLGRSIVEVEVSSH